MRLYLSGCITADLAGYKAKFAKAENDLWLGGYFVVNPATNVIPGGTWLDYMRLDVAQLVICDGVATLPGWEAGRGTWVEVNLAHGLGLPVHPLDYWKANPQ